ncbi:MAG: formate dehydrogenase alpha subunit [Bacillota bacterium]|nr:formate dehydrogenase alpha subunit [Bacillota bacterium]
MPCTVTIDGKRVDVEPGTTVLEAARAAGADIPTLCHDPALPPMGACRLCVVEVEGAKGPVASCAMPVSDGMVVRTETDKVIASRRFILDLLLSDHPKDCLTCEKNGACKLQEYAYRYGVRSPRLVGRTRKPSLDQDNPFIERDNEKCILCGRCVRVCQGVQQVGAIDYAYRGFDSKVTPAYDEGLDESPCVFCGNCVAVCPVGALTPKMEKMTGRAWEKSRVRTICPYCGTGCAIFLLVKDGKVVGVEPAKDGPANHGWLCVKGRFGYEFIHHPDRLTQPLVRRDGKLVPATWDEALDLVASRLGEVKRQHGPDAVAGLSSARCTNEENYVIQKFMRAAIGTNNIDHCARLCHASTVAGLAAAFGSGAMTNSIDEILMADAIFVIGSNTTETHPVIALRVKEAVRQGAKLIVADPRKIELAEMADVHLQHIPGTDVALLCGIMRVILKQGLYDEEFIATRTEGFEEFARSLEPYTLEFVEGITGVPAGHIVRAARLYAEAERGTILYTMGITQHTTGTDNVLAIANLAMLTGNVGREGTGVNPLRGQNNVQGACDMGALPNFLPGYQKVDDERARARFEDAWGAVLPRHPGLTVGEMFAAAEEGRVRAMYICGENPVVSDPDATHVRKALEKLDFLVVQDIFLTETAALADVVLPAASFAEKDGTFTNTERRVQLVSKAVDPPGEARADWEIVVDLARRMGYRMEYTSSAEIMEEVALLTPIYGGVRHGRLGTEGLQWPCPSVDHPGTRFLHKEKFSRGRGRFSVVEFIPPDELPDDEYPVVFTTGRVLYHYHTGSMTRRSEGLNWLCPEAFVELDPATARERGIADGDLVRVASRRGEVVARARVSERIGPRTAFMPFHFAEAAANVLTNPALDRVAKIPELKVCAVRVERVGPPGEPLGASGTTCTTAAGRAARCATAGHIITNGIDLSKVDEIFEGFESREGILIPMLQKLQDVYGYLPRPALERAAKLVKVPLARIYGVATFYAQFRLRPRGRNIIRVCQGTACHVRGGREILKEVQEVLGIGPGESTEDLRFSLEPVACLGACGLAPTMMINDDTYGRLTPRKVRGILEKYR